MELLGVVFSSVYALLAFEFDLLGFTLSFWQVILWTTVAGLLLRFFRRLFG